MRPALLTLFVLSALAALAFLACDGARSSYQPQPKPEVALPPGA